MGEFKIGDYVRIVSDSEAHSYLIGKIGKVVGPPENKGLLWAELIPIDFGVTLANPIDSVYTQGSVRFYSPSEIELDKNYVVHQILKEL